jgi:hypothetical protein
MSKKFGLFGDSDLFLARKLKPLMDETKMRKFQGSKYIAGCLVALTLFLPYWYINFINLGSTNKNSANK